MEVILRKPQVVITGLQYGALDSAISLRRATSLAGLSRLQQVEPDQLQALADPDDADGDGISGRMGITPRTAEAGRFGWKASVSSLRAQTAKALALDLGLGNSLLPSAAGDCTTAQLACQQAAHRDDKLEVPDLVMDLLLAYLASLPPPPSPSLKASAESGLFTSLGCAACHVPQLATTDGLVTPFSDLLLHDLGPGLADALPSADSAEWRTAPLWGLGQTTRYLHDARAASLEEAILWHGGEAAASVEAYRRLNAAQRQLLHSWLLGL